MEKLTKELVVDCFEDHVIGRVRELKNSSVRREVLDELVNIIKLFQQTDEDFICEHEYKDYSCENVDCKQLFCMKCIDDNPSIQRICAPKCYQFGRCSCLTEKTNCACSPKCLQIVRRTNNSRRYPAKLTIAI